MLEEKGTEKGRVADQKKVPRHGIYANHTILMGKGGETCNR